jgi:uncharacterized membrane protein YeaQ/YmgE (transglycosylase-associated protein family)
MRIWIFGLICGTLGLAIETGDVGGSLLLLALSLLGTAIAALMFNS